MILHRARDILSRGVGLSKDSVIRKKSLRVGLMSLTHGADYS